MTGQRPNVLWLMTDQHRADCLGYMGHPAIQTPHLDSLAASGIVFENAFCQSPVCMASRGSVMTGRYPEAIRVRGMGVLPPDELTVAEILKRGGYRTGAFGKLHLTPQQYTRSVLGSDDPILDLSRFGETGLTPSDDPCKQNYGFDRYVGCEDNLQGSFRRWLAAAAPALKEREIHRFQDGSPGDLFVSPYPSAYHQSTFIANACADFIDRTDEPWFAFCSFVAPHHPFEAPADQIARYPLESVPLPAWKGGVDAGLVPPPINGAINEFSQYPELAQRRIVQHYLASISLIDDNIGRLVQCLRRSGQLDNTIIVFVADHGEFLGNHGLLRKPSMHYDEVVRVPLLFRLTAGAGAGRRVPGLVELVDVLPTLLGLLEVPIHAGIQGRDWSACLQDGRDIGRDDIYSDMYNMAPMVLGQASGPYGACLTLRTEDWKLSIYPQTDPSFGQLFCLRDDPDEAHNLYATATAQRQEMLWRMLQRQHRNVDPLPLRLSQW